jgi:hypothetical protein
LQLEPDSRLWRETLGPRSPDAQRDVRDRLRVSLADIRARSEPLATAISQDLPQLSVHDGRHIDALWPLADLICSPSTCLTPTEAWVLGVAIVLHDLGLPVAAYPGGRAELQALPEWKDARAAALRARLRRSPTSTELAAHDELLDTVADEATLRKRHAERAAELVHVRWTGGHRLIADDDLQNALGSVAGRIASSHWWPAERLRELGRTEGAPAGMPSTWTVRPILLGAILRVADAAHLDALRAPQPERAIRRLGSIAREHWDFQERLRQPVLDGDRLRFTSSRPFGPDDAAAWWRCLDALRLLDDELASCDAVLQGMGLPRLAARSVEGVRDPRQLAQSVCTHGWVPVEAQVGVSDIPQLIDRLGGEALYGDEVGVPLRELIQNACDAVRARQALQPGFSGAIVARATSDGRTLEVQDNGIGMGQEVLTGALIDFGRSLWSSSELATVLPGLAGTGFQPIGRFGIGFFSVFMWTDDVEVISRPKGCAEEETRVLAFSAGLRGRPLLRIARPDERLDEPGTLVRLRIPDDGELGILLESGNPDGELEHEDDTFQDHSFREFVRWLAPALSVNLSTAIDTHPPKLAIEGDDWLKIGRAKMHKRVTGGDAGPTGDDDLLTTIGDPTCPSGRGSLIGSGATKRAGVPTGVLVAGGLRVAETNTIAGVLRVEEFDLARRHGVPVASPAEITAWASAQARCIASSSVPSDPSHVAAVLALGGDTGSLPLTQSATGWLSYGDVIRWAATRQRVWITSVVLDIHTARRKVVTVSPPLVILRDGVLDTSFARSYGALTLTGIDEKTVDEAILEAVAKGWSTSPSAIQRQEVTRKDLIRLNDGGDAVKVEGLQLVRPDPLRDRSES